MNGSGYEVMMVGSEKKIITRQEHITSKDYVEFLSRTDRGKIVGNCFGLTDVEWTEF